MRTFRVLVTQEVEVQLDETKFTPEFMAEYAETITPLDMLEQHAEHLAWVQATGVDDMEGRANPFVEGYGPVKDMGITARVLFVETEVTTP